MNQKISAISRYLLGLIFFFFGTAGLFNLLPTPTDLPEKLMTFTSGLAVTGYFFPLLKGTEALCGLLLLLGIAPALMLIVLAPITLNIFLVHLFLTPGISNLVLPVIIAALHALAAVKYWKYYRPLFDKNR